MKFFALCLVLCAAALPAGAQQDVFACPGQAPDSIFYQRVDALPLAATSAAYTGNIAPVQLSWDSSWQVSVNNSHGETATLNFYYTPGYSGIWRYPVWWNVSREGGSLGGNYPADHHTIVVDHDTCRVWETYHAYVNVLTGGLETGQFCNQKPCNAQSGWQYGPTDHALPTQGTTDAAGLPLLPLLWRAHEIMDGRLTHPVRFTLARGFIQAGHPQWPAVGTNGWGGSNVPPYGTRFRVKAAFTPNLSSLTPLQQSYAQIALTALKNYGLVLADIGISMNANVDIDATLNPDLMKALATLGGQITPAQLEVPDLSSLMISPSSYQAKGAAAPVATVRVGTPYTYLNIQAGTSFPLRSWVNGTAVQTVKWSTTIGSVTASGLFTAPATSNGITQGIATVASAVNPQATATVYVRVLPAGPIRIVAGNQTSPVTDGLGQVWQPNLFLAGGDTTARAGDYPAWPKPSNPTQAAELAIYESFYYTYGNDIVGQFVVPNGTYSIRLLFGQPYNASKPASCSPFPASWHSPVAIEVQDQIVTRNYDFGASINHACAVPVDYLTNATVAANTLEFALRNTEPDGTTTTTSPVLSGVEILRVP